MPQLLHYLQVDQSTVIESKEVNQDNTEKSLDYYLNPNREVRKILLRMFISHNMSSLISDIDTVEYHFHTCIISCN